MSKIYKKMMALCLIAVLALSLAACGGSADSNGQNEGTASESGNAPEQPAVTSGEWKNDPEAYLSGINAADYVTLPEDYTTMQLVAEKPAVVTDADVESLENSFRSVGDEVHDGDTVNINYIGIMDGEQFQGGTANGQYLTIGSGSFIDGFESGLIGAHTGETVTLDLSFPDPYENNPDLAGKPVQFIVTINTIYLAEPPELTDEYVAGLGLPDKFGNPVATVDAYHTFVRDYLETQAEYSYNNELYSQIMEILSSKCTYADDFPKSMVDRYNEEVIADMTNKALQYGTDLKTLMMSYGIGEDEYLDVLRQQAVEQVKYLLALQAVAEKEGLTISDETLENELADLAARDSMAAQGYTSVDSFDHDERESYREYLMRQKVLEFLKKNAEITEPAAETETSEEPAG